MVIKKTVREKIFDSFNVLFLILFSISIIIPVIFVINQSMMNNDDIIKYGYTLLPKSVNLSAYSYLLVDNTFIYRGFAVSIFLTVVGTFLNIMFTCLFAYGLSKKYLPYRKAITVFVFITMIFGGGLIPSYMLITKLGLRDSLWALIIPGLISQWNLFIMRNFFMTIPASLEESASIDGASDLIILIKIIIPLSLAAIATVGLYYAVGHWNGWFGASIYIDSQKKWPLQLILRTMIASLDVAGMGDPSKVDKLMQNMPKESVKSAAIFITTVPIVCVYPFLQKYFVKGVIVGSVKG